MIPTLVDGDIVAARADAIVNAYNRNIIPWWLLVPQGVSGAIRKHAGTAPFRELARTGPLPLGHARLTGAGRLLHQGIIHVAGIDMTWRASERSIRESTRNAVRVAEQAGFASLAMPIIGGGTGGFGDDGALTLMLDTLATLDTALDVTIVRWSRP